MLRRLFLFLTLRFSTSFHVAPPSKVYVIICTNVLVLSRDRRYCRVVVYSSVDGLIITHPLRSTKNRKSPRSLFGYSGPFVLRLLLTSLEMGEMET
jgi:hypothetical protein